MVWVASYENPGFAAAWSPSPPPPIFIGVAEPLLMFEYIF